MDPIENYEHNSYWKKYEPFFPSHLRGSKVGILPREEQWNWKDYSIHIDRLDHPQPKAHIIFVHGAGGYGRFLLPFAISCHRSGYSAIAPDLPGYGLTFPKKKTLRYNDWIDFLSDLIDEESKAQSRPIALMGLSLGGMLCYQVAARNKKVKAVITTTLADTRLSEVRKSMMKFGNMGEVGLGISAHLPAFFDNLMVPVSKLSKMDHMSGNREFCNLVCRDKLGGDNSIPLGFLRSLCETAPAIEPENFTTPFLLAHPGNDTWTPTELSKPFFDRIAGMKRFVSLENCGHAPVEEPGGSTLERETANFLSDVFEK
jgi:alpha-beta hydrolase superfamily lysophospholipase